MMISCYLLFSGECKTANDVCVTISVLPGTELVSQPQTLIVCVM